MGGYHKRTDATVGPDGLLPEGSQITWVFSGFESVTYIWHPKTYQSFFELAGFVDFEFFLFGVPPSIAFDKKKIESLGPRILCSPAIGIKARRPANLYSPNCTA